MWTAFPPAFAAISSTLYVPLTLVALGVIARGSAFAFRKAIDQPWAQRLFGAAFAFSSVVTPYFLGAAAGRGGLRPGAARAGPRQRGLQLGEPGVGGDRRVRRRGLRVPGRQLPDPGRPARPATRR